MPPTETTETTLQSHERLDRLEAEVGELRQRVAAALETVRSLPLPASAGADVTVSEVTA